VRLPANSSGRLAIRGEGILHRDMADLHAGPARAAEDLAQAETLGMPICSRRTLGAAFL
jgi:hypothetical protein